MAYLHEQFQPEQHPDEGEFIGTEQEMNLPEVPDTYDTDVAGLHFDNLFDQDEDGAGEIIDITTGERIDNSTSDEKTELVGSGIGRVVSLSELNDPVDPDMEDDEAARWLREHDKAA